MMKTADHWKVFKTRNRTAIYGLLSGLPVITLIANLLKVWNENIAGVIFITLILYGEWHKEIT
jgi:hypothetical protein